MGKCSCYRMSSEKHRLTDFEKGLYVGSGKVPPEFTIRTHGECWGTREQDRCNCGGDEEKCDFYEDVRNRAKQTEISAKKSDTSKTMWHNFPEEKPKIAKEYLICSRRIIDNNFSYQICYYNPKGKRFSYYDSEYGSIIIDNVVAWVDIEEQIELDSTKFETEKNVK